MMKTGLLLAALTALFMTVGALIGGTQGMIVALGFALLSNAFAYWFSDSVVLRMHRAEPMDDIRHGRWLRIIRELSARAGIPAPKAYIMHNMQPNAFATGRSPNHAAVAVTTGLLDMLQEEEVAAVIAHELGHIKNRDTLTMTITATIAGAISSLAQFAMFFGGNNRDSRSNPLVTLAIVIFAPLAAMIVQFAISRTREFSADKAGAEISGMPLMLASALRKISRASRHIPNMAAENHPESAHMFIMNPLHMHKIDGLFSTHPDPEKRIALLEEMARATGHSTDHFMPDREDSLQKARRSTFDFTD